MLTGPVPRAVVVLFLTVVMPLTGGCAPEKDSAAPVPLAGWPDRFADFTMVWSAEPGIDLTTGTAVVVRAYTESYQLAALMGDDRYLYPGFKQSVEHGPYLWPESNRPTETPWVGTERDHILTITRSGRDITAVVCVYTYDSAMQEHEGEYSANAGNPFEPNAGIYPMRITLTAPADGVPQTPRQVGSARTPGDDVFDGWRIIGRLGGYFTTTSYPAAVDACAVKAPDPPTRREFLISRYLPRSEFPTLPAYPGWPATPH